MSSPTDADADALAALHAVAFADGPRPWSAAEIAALLGAPGAFLCSAAGAGFALGRVAADEAELLTIAVHPDARRAGHGRALMDRFAAAAQARGARRAFLEVAAGNAAARALYARAGFRETGRRTGYYGPRDDAIVMTRTLG